MLAGGGPTSSACCSFLRRKFSLPPSLRFPPKLSFGPIRPSALDYFPVLSSYCQEYSFWVWTRKNKGEYLAAGFFIGRNKSRLGECATLKDSSSRAFFRSLRCIFKKNRKNIFSCFANSIQVGLKAKKFNRLGMLDKCLYIMV
jgi:hypothetical protein